MSDLGIKHVSRTVIVGKRGLPVIERGYTDLGGVRIYEDMVVIGPHGEHCISPGWTSISPKDETY